MCVLTQYNALTVAKTISQSSRPNAFTIRTRTKHRNAHASTAVTTNAMLTRRSSGPLLAIAMARALSNHCTQEPKRSKASKQRYALGNAHFIYKLRTRVELLEHMAGDANCHAAHGLGCNPWALAWFVSARRCYPLPKRDGSPTKVGLGTEHRS